MKRIIAAITLLSALSLTGCVTISGFVPTEVNERRAIRQEAAVPEFFAYQKDRFDLSDKNQVVPEFKKESYEVFRVTFPSAFSTDPKNDEVVFHYFRQKSEGKKPLVIILPIMGGGYFFSEHFAKKLAKNGFHAIWLERKGQLFREDAVAKAASEEELKGSLVYTRNVYRQAIIDTMRVVDWAESKPEIDAERIGIAGISLGAIMSATALGADPRLKAGMLMLGGGDIALILSTSDEPPMKEIRESVLAHLGWSQDTLHRKLKEWAAPIDPLTYAPRVDPESVLLMDGIFDEVVPPVSADLLWNALGKPQRIRIPTGHYTAFFYLLWADRKMVQHFTKTLKPSP